jgi:protein phosphatase
MPLLPSWPSIAWEANLLARTQHPVLPRVLDRFREGEFEYLIEEAPLGRNLWDAWEDRTVPAGKRFGWLKELAESLDQLHRRGAILEGLRPDIVVVSAQGQARLTDLSELLPLPLPAEAPIRGTYYTAPELVLAGDRADARADLYGFGALLYALYLGRELTELDFELQGVPKAFLDRFPDAHPLFGRLVSKTLCRDLALRFPTEEGSKDDPTGFQELLLLLEFCGQQLDRARLEIAAWSTTGIVRSGNEDAFCVLSTSNCREDNANDAALILLADGMGGHEGGEVAAALALDTMRQFLLQQPALAHLTGALQTTRAKTEEYQDLLDAALKEANERVHSAARANSPPKQMGCTAEAVYVDGRQIIIGHVGDSRTYHFHEGRLLQLTRDQTWVNRMVDLGALTAKEAEEHPRRSEIQQAIGGHARVEPALYHAELTPGDWIIVCSDGLFNPLTAESIRHLLQSSASAEAAARRLVNAANLHGATDNATVVVVKVT